MLNVDVINFKTTGTNTIIICIVLLITLHSSFPHIHIIILIAEFYKYAKFCFTNEAFAIEAFAIGGG